ncbi:8022_t:CDS:1, partial [Cetraspora pellucida]
MPKKITKKRLDFENPNMSLVEQPVGEPNLMSSECIKQIELWLENTKTYNLSGVFNRLH